MTDPNRFTFTGRMVGGDCFKPQPQRKDDRTGALKFLKNGEPDAPFYVSIAVPKNPAARFAIAGNPSYEDEKAKIDALARAAWPPFFGQRPQGLQFGAELAPDCTNPKFANKIIDGDGFDDKGKPYANNEGWAGCWVIKVQRYYAPKGWFWGNGWEEITPHAGPKIKPGDYITVSGTCESNKSSDSPGMYMNHDTISFEQEGPEIVLRGAVDPNAALGQRGAPNSPPASATAPSAPAATGGAPAPGTDGSTTAPGYSGYRETAAPPPPPAPAGPQMTAKAAGATYEQFIANGWTDEAMRAQGYIV